MFWNYSLTPSHKIQYNFLPHLSLSLSVSQFYPRRREKVKSINERAKQDVVLIVATCSLTLARLHVFCIFSLGSQFSIYMCGLCLAKTERDKAFFFKVLLRWRSANSATVPQHCSVNQIKPPFVGNVMQRFTPQTS